MQTFSYLSTTHQIKHLTNCTLTVNFSVSLDPLPIIVGPGVDAWSLILPFAPDPSRHHTTNGEFLFLIAAYEGST